MSSPIRNLACALAAIACACAAPPLLASAASASVQRGVDGTNVVSVRVNDGGTFEETGPGRWTQFEPNGRPFNRLEEVRRDRFSVTLTDRARRVDVILDLRSREVRGTTPGSRNIRTFYTIVDAESHRGRDWRGDDRGPRGHGRDDGPRDVRDRDARDGGWGRGRGSTQNVEAGPIWNQGDAERKCRAKAAEMRGEWTGQWHTTVQGRMSVCEIRFR